MDFKTKPFAHQLECFEKIKELPKKARSGLKKENLSQNRLLTFFRQGHLKKFYINNAQKVDEITFFDTVEMLECIPETKREKIPPDYFNMLSANKNKMELDLTVGDEPTAGRGGRSNVKYVLQRLKAKDCTNFKKFTDSDDDYLQDVIKMLEQAMD